MQSETQRQFEAHKASGHCAYKYNFAGTIAFCPHDATDGEYCKPHSLETCYIPGCGRQAVITNPVNGELKAECDEHSGQYH